MESEIVSPEPRPRSYGEGAHHYTPTKTAIYYAIKSLTDIGSLRRGRQGDPILNNVKSNLLSEEIEEDWKQRMHDDQLFHDNDLPWYASLHNFPVLAVHRALVPDLTLLVHAV